MDDQLHKIIDKNMGLCQAPKGVNMMKGHNWLRKVINIEARIKDTPKKGQFRCFYCGKPYKGVKCLFNHNLRCKQLQDDVHMYIEARLQMAKKNKFPEEGKFWCINCSNSFKTVQGLCKHNAKCDMVLCLSHG